MASALLRRGFSYVQVPPAGVVPDSRQVSAGGRLNFEQPRPCAASSAATCSASGMVAAAAGEDVHRGGGGRSRCRLLMVLLLLSFGVGEYLGG